MITRMVDTGMGHAVPSVRNGRTQKKVVRREILSQRLTIAINMVTKHLTKSA